MSETFERAIGLDIGNTTACVAVWENGGVHIIADDEGEPTTTPVCIGFCEDRLIVGDIAKSEVILGESNTVFDLLHMLGRRYDDPELQTRIPRWPFKVVQKDQQPYVQIQLQDQARLFSPQELSAKVIAKMIETAEVYIHKKIDKVVLTVPASFNPGQRQAIEEAAKLAGMHSVHLIDKPVAAVLPYLHRVVVGEEEKRILVFHLGGRSCEATVLAMSDQDTLVPRVVAVAADTCLGGDSFTKVLLESCKAEVRQQFNEDITTDPFTLSQFHQSCERAKIHLSSSSSMSSSTAFGVYSLVHGFTYSTEISRAQFEELSSNLFNRVVQVTERALKAAQMHKTDVDEIFLMGGSTSIPKVRTMLQQLFVDKPLRTLDEALSLTPSEVRTLGEKALSPDEFAAYGAAYYGHVLSTGPMGVKED